MLNMPRDFSVNYCEINDTITDQVKKESSEQGGDDVVQGKSFSNRKPSIVWSFMIKENSTSVKCQLCNHQFKFDGSTSPMLKHLKVRHKGEYSVILREGALPAQATPKVEIDVAEEEDKSSSEKECASSPQTRASKKKSRAAKSVNPLKRLNQYGLDQPRVGVASKRSLAKGLSKKPVSIVWSFMIREAPHKIKCTICNHEFKENGSTSPMLKHIKRRHEEEYKALMEEESLTAQKESSSTVQMDLDEQENVSDSEKECVRSTRKRLSKKNSRVDKSVSALKKLEKDGLAQVRTNVNLERNVIKNSSGKPVNIVWRFMIRENWKTAKCKICNGQLKYHGTIAALRKHLKRKHAEEFAVAEEEGTPFMSSKTVSSAETSINRDFSSAETSSPDQTDKSVNATKKLEKSLEQPKINVDPVRSFTYNKFGRKPVSIVWKFMIRENPNTVKCKICNRLLKYHGGFTSPLRKHLKRMHHEEFAVAEEGGTPDISSKTVPSAETGTNQETTYVETSTADQTLNEISNSEEVATLTEKSNSLSKKRKVSPIWKYMLRVGINKTMCRLCKRRFNYFNGCTSHMHKHIQRNHPEELGILKVMKRKEVKNFAGSSNASNFLPENVENSKNQEMTDVETSSPEQTEKSENARRNVHYNKFSRKPVSIVWRFIIRENRNTVRCKICHRQLKYAGFTSPLHKHLKRMHQAEFAVADEGGTPDMCSKTVPSAETGINQEISSGETSSPDQTEKPVNATKKFKKGLEQSKIDVDPVRNVNYNKFRRKVVSIVWTFMIRESHNMVKCTICNRQMKYDSSAMRKHLRRKHQQEFAMAQEERTPFMSSKTLPSAETSINQEILSAETTSLDQTRKSSNASTRLEQGCFEQSRVDVEQRTSVMERGIRELEPADEMDLDEEDNLLDSDEEYLPNSLTKHPEKRAMVEKSVNATKSQRVGVEPNRSLAKGLSKKPVSIVWSFMIREAPHIVKCKICNHEFKDSPTGSTSTMLKHLRRRHLEELTAVEEGGTLTLPRELESVVEAALDEESNIWDSDEEYLPNSLTKHLEKKPMKEIGLAQARINVNPMRNVTKNFSRKPVSIVWRFMIRENHNRVKCTICNRQMKYDWSAMRKHLKRKHQQEFAMAEEERTSFMSSKTLPSAETGINREIVCVKTGSADKSLNEISNFEEVHAAKSVLPLIKKNCSPLWNYMLLIEENRAVCRLCSRKFNFFNGWTSHMHKHLRRIHPEEARLLSSQKSVAYNFSTGRSPGASTFLPESGSRQTNYLVNMAVGNLYPSAIVEKESFIKFVHMLSPSFSVPGTEMMEKAVINQHKRQKTLLLNQLDKVQGVSISTEIWTYRERQQYMTVTGHFVSETWDVQSAVLNTVLLDSRFDLSSSIAERLEEILNQWNIVDKVKCIVTDNTAQQSAAVAKLSKPGLHCIALALNSTVQESLDASNDIGYLATRVRDICNFFLHSVEASHKLKLLQLAEDKTPLRLERDTESDWISTYRMFKRYADLHTYLGQAASELSMENTLLVAEELELLDWCVQILEPFVLATEDLVSDNFTAVSKSLPVLEILKHRSSNLPQEVQNPAVVEHGSAIAFTNELHSRIEKWISVIGDRENFLPWATTLLDPRFKHLVVEDPEMQKWVVAQLQQLIEPLAPNEDMVANEHLEVAKTENDTNLNNIDGSLWLSFDQTIWKSVCEKPVDELQRYIEERPTTRQEDPLKWWMEREHLYPKLSKIVKQFLCIPATSLPPSQIFLEEKRRKLCLRNFIEESQLDSFLFLSTCQIVN